MEQDQKMTEQPEQPRHGEPGHVCQPRTIDATETLAGVIIGQHPTDPRKLTADTWSHGMTKRDFAFILHQLADEYDQDADLEDAQATGRRLN
jgi:hypothetical protein